VHQVAGTSVADDAHCLSEAEEDRYAIGQAEVEQDAEGNIIDDRIEVRLKDGDIGVTDANGVDFVDVSPRQMVSVGTAMIPFLEHDDANRALMGANIQKQAVPLVRGEAPYVGTGMELRAAYDAGDMVITPKAGVVENVNADLITIMDDEGIRDTYMLRKFERTNQGTNYNQTPLVN